MLHLNPYFFFRSMRESDLPVIVRWMGAQGRLTGDGELRVLRQLKRQYRDPDHAAGRQSWMAVRCGQPNFWLERTVTGELYLTGHPSIHTNPWRALEAWGYSIPWVSAVAEALPAAASATAAVDSPGAGLSEARMAERLLSPGLPAAARAVGPSAAVSSAAARLSEIRIPLPESRVAEIRALKALGCRRIGKEVDFEEEVWVWGADGLASAIL
ncbi:MAG TPA: hypothetical protein VNS58_01075 [Puia sp.]|nr:hypothetical protein [Puia sp.]